MFIQDSDLSQAVSDCLQFSPTDPISNRPYYASLITAENTAAYWMIINALMNRGWSKAQIDQWDRGAEFQRAIGLFGVLAQIETVDPKSFQFTRARIDALHVKDRHEELKTVNLTIAGQWQEQETTKGVVVVGEVHGWRDGIDHFPRRL